MSDPPPHPHPPTGEAGGPPALDPAFPYTETARRESMRRLVNLAHGLGADGVGDVPTYPVQLEAHKVLQGYLKANADREANELKRRAVEVQERDAARKAEELALKRRAVEVQEGTLAIKREALDLERERFEDGRKTRRKSDSIADLTAEAEERAETRKRDRRPIR